MRDISFPHGSFMYLLAFPSTLISADARKPSATRGPIVFLYGTRVKTITIFGLLDASQDSKLAGFGNVLV